LTQRDQSGRNPHDRTPCSHQDLLLQQARRINALQLLSGVLLPTVFPFGDLPFGIREIALREFAVHANTVLMQNNTPTSDGQRVNALLYRRFSLSGNRRLWCRASLATQNPDCTPPVLHSLWRPHSTTSPLRSCDRGSRDRDFTGRKFLALQNPESRFSDATCQHLPGRPTSGHLSPSRSIGISRFGSSHLLIHKVTDPAKPRIPTPPDLPPRVLSPINGSGRFGKSPVAISKGLSPCLQERRTPNSDPQGSYATCPCSNQRLPLNREIATRDSNEHETLASSNAEARYADIRWPAPSCA
jgi:hypothetical protein